jgi:anti-sigma factor RsiW
MMRCDEVASNLDAYLAGELPPGVRVEVEAHMQRCAACRRVLERAERLSVLLAGTPAPPVPERFAERVLASARSRKEREVAAWSIRAWWLTLSTSMRVAAAAALLVGATLGLVVGWNTAESPGRANAGPLAAKADPLGGYSLDYLGDAPDGSLAASYLSLVAGRGGEGR